MPGPLYSYKQLYIAYEVLLSRVGDARSITKEVVPELSFRVGNGA
jgi:hypothetical protein